jgi:hypothetical protein
VLLLLIGVAAVAWFARGGSRTIGTIDGTVTEVDGEQVVIIAQREAQVGDPVAIYFAIPGFDQLGTVGSGTVLEVGGARVTARIERRTGDLVMGQIAKIGEIPAGPIPAPAGWAADEPTAAAAVSSPTPVLVAAGHPGLPPAYLPPARGRGGGTTPGAFVGCFADTSAFDLDGHLERSRANTPQSCIAKCRELGFRYAGVQYGESCLCGNSYGRYGGAESCNYPCTGDPGQTCGGYSANSVYETGGSGSEPHPPPPPLPP